MIPAARVYIDTNIFIYGLEGGSTVSDRIADLLTKAHAAPGRFVTCEMAAAELLVRPYRHRDLAIIDQYEHILSGAAGIGILPLTLPAYRHAAALRAAKPSLRLPDALHLATAIASACSHFLTADLGIALPSDVPDFGVQGGPASGLAILRPDLSTLSSLLQSLDP